MPEWYRKLEDTVNQSYIREQTTNPVTVIGHRLEGFGSATSVVVPSSAVDCQSPAPPRLLHL
jgi:hypothetical protein